MSAQPPVKLLFVSHHNDARSQIATVLANKLGAGNVEAISAGPEPEEVPDFIQHLAQTLSGEEQLLKSSALDEVRSKSFDTIIVLCDKSQNAPSGLPQDTEYICWNFPFADTTESLKHLEIELVERIRLLLLARHVT